MEYLTLIALAGFALGCLALALILGLRAYLRRRPLEDAPADLEWWV